MAKKRIIYQSAEVYGGPTPASAPHTGALGENYLRQFTRVQSANYNWTVNRRDVNQFGQLAAISREVVESPTVSFGMTYYISNLANEAILGFNIDGQTSCVSGILNGTTDEKNYFLLHVPEGKDAVGNTDRADWQVYGFGNGFLSNYSVEASVGNFPTATVSLETLNASVILGDSGPIPAINPENGSKVEGVEFVIPTAFSSHSGEIPVIKPGDVTLSLQTPFGAEVTGAGACHIQSFNLSIPLSRQPLNRLGSAFAFSREIQYPVTATMTVQAQASDFKSGNLADLLCSDGEFDLTVTMKQPGCGTGIRPNAATFEMRGAKIDSQRGDLNIGSAGETVEIQYSCQISGPEDLLHGVFMSGYYIAP